MNLIEKVVGKLIALDDEMHRMSPATILNIARQNEEMLDQRITDLSHRLADAQTEARRARMVVRRLRNVMVESGKISEREFESLMLSAIFRAEIDEAKRNG